MRLCAILLLFSASHSAQGATPPESDARQIDWQRTLDDALALARAESRPLLIAVNMDGESASDRIVHEEYRDPEFVASTRACVCLVASVFRHSLRDYDDEGRRIPCPRLGAVTCGEHIALEPLLYERFLADGERVAPRHAVVLEDGSKAWDISLAFDLCDIDRALFDSVRARAGGPRAGDSEGAGGSSWAALTALRSQRGRSRLEDALARVQDEDTLTEALYALAARGDAGALDGLRVVCGALPWITADARERVVSVARALDLAEPLAASLRTRVGAPGGVDSGAGIGADRVAVWLPALAALDGDSPGTRSLLLACCAVDGYGAEAERALTVALGPDGAASALAAREANGGPLSLQDALRAAEAVTRAAQPGELPRRADVSDAMPETAALEQELARLDSELGARGDDADLRARFAKASLDLARRRLEARANGAQVLLEDAERNFALALERVPDRALWWIERARAAYFRGRFEEELAYGRRALALTGDPATDALAIEALRWVGDGNARLLGTRSGGDPAVELAGITEGLHALAVVAASAYGDATDWTSCASFLGALGLRREALAVALRGAERLPEATELRQAMDDELWSSGRIELGPDLAESVASRNAASAGALWHAGYAWILAAEDHRRREACAPAVRAYARARARFEAAAALSPDWADGCAYYVGLTWLGQGLAEVRLNERERAADDLVAAAATHAALTDARDGLGYDVLDLVDKVLEWRASGASPVDPLALLERLESAAPGTAFWAAAVSDSELREALRADGRNPERAERDSVDASGNPIRQVMGLPWVEGDAYLGASLIAGRRAFAQASAEEDKKPLAQAATIRAERALELGRLDGVQAALAEAAVVWGLDPPPPDADEASLRALAKRLRAELGEARPRFRPGR